MLVKGDTGLLYQKLASSVGTSNYIAYYLQDTISGPCPWYLLLAQYSSYMIYKDAFKCCLRFNKCNKVYCLQSQFWYHLLWKKSSVSDRVLDILKSIWHHSIHYEKYDIRQLSIITYKTSAISYQYAWSRYHTTVLTYRGRDKMDAILQTIFSKSFF